MDTTFHILYGSQVLSHDVHLALSASKSVQVKFYYKDLSSPRFYWKVESVDATPLLYGSQVLSYD